MKTVCRVSQETGTAATDVKKTEKIGMAANEAIAVCDDALGTQTTHESSLKAREVRTEQIRVGTVCIAYGNGCPRSRISAAKLYPYFEANGWHIEHDLKKADLVLVSTCGVNQRAEKKSLRLLSIANRKKKTNTRLVVLGCLAGINKKVLAEKFDPIVIAPIEAEKLDDLIGAKIKLKKIRDVNLVKPIISKSQKSFSMIDRAISEFEPSSMFLHRVLDHLKPKKIERIRESAKENAFSIRILDGCPGECSYCAIKFAEGPLV